MNDLYIRFNTVFLNLSALIWIISRVEQLELIGSPVSRVGCKFMIKELMVQIPAPTLCMLMCPWARYWIPPNGAGSTLDGSSRPLVNECMCECEALVECEGAGKLYGSVVISHLLSLLGCLIISCAASSAGSLRDRKKKC